MLVASEYCSTDGSGPRCAPPRPAHRARGPGGPRRPVPPDRRCSTGPGGPRPAPRMADARVGLSDRELPQDAGTRKAWLTAPAACGYASRVLQYESRIVPPPAAASPGSAREVQAEGSGHGGERAGGCCEAWQRKAGSPKKIFLL